MNAKIDVKIVTDEETFIVGDHVRIEWENGRVDEGLISHIDLKFFSLVGKEKVYPWPEDLVKIERLEK